MHHSSTLVCAAALIIGLPLCFVSWHKCFGCGWQYRESWGEAAGDTQSPTLTPAHRVGPRRLVRQDSPPGRFGTKSWLALCLSPVIWQMKHEYLFGAACAHTVTWQWQHFFFFFNSYLKLLSLLPVITKCSFWGFADQVFARPQPI